MISYKDKTFCIAKCANQECTRKYTKEVRKKADEWWGDEGAPVAVGDFSKTCIAYIPLKEEKK